VELLAASLVEHLQIRDAQIAEFLVAGYPLCLPLFRSPRLRFVGYEAANDLAELRFYKFGSGTRMQGG
jgi:hypothetical protein